MTKDLYDLRTSGAWQTFYRAEDVCPADFDTDSPSVSFRHQGVESIILIVILLSDVMAIMNEPRLYTRSGNYDL